MNLDIHFLPPFPKNKQRNLRISDEAWKGLEELASKVAISKKNGNLSVSNLLETIGLYQLSLVQPLYTTYTEEAHGAGHADAIEGREANYSLIFKSSSRQMYEAYMRGYWEGTYVLIERKKEHEKSQSD